MTTTTPAVQVKLALDYNEETIVKRIPQFLTLAQIMVQARQIATKAEIDKSEKLEIAYFDQDGDKILMETDQDVLLAYETATDAKIKFVIELPSLR
jgi:PB1 domain